MSQRKDLLLARMRAIEDSITELEDRLLAARLVLVDLKHEIEELP